MKWSVIGGAFFKKRFELLSDFLSQSGISNQLEIIEVTPSEFSDKNVHLKDCSRWIRIENPYGEAALKELRQVPMEMQSISAADGMYIKSGEWHPQNSYVKVFNSLLTEHGSRLDLNSEVLIIGAGLEARAAVASTVRAGFKSINLTCNFDDEGIDLIRHLRRYFMGIEFRLIPQDHLVLLPGANALAINTASIEESRDLLNELSYLNFLRPDGMIWDLVMFPVQTPLLKEASQINVPCVSGHEIAARVDAHWMATLGFKIVWRDLSRLYFERLSDLGPVT